MRNNTNYAETGVLTALQMTSSFPQVILDNFYVKSRNSIHSGQTEAPYAFVIPSDQADMTRVAFVIKILRMQGIEVGRTTAALKLKDGDYPAGSLLVKCDQPYGRLAKTLLGKQVDPDPELTTYDDSAWTMGLMTNTTIKPTADVSVLKAATEPVNEYIAPSQPQGRPRSRSLRHPRSRLAQHDHPPLRPQGHQNPDRGERVQVRRHHSSRRHLHRPRSHPLNAQTPRHPARPRHQSASPPNPPSPSTTQDSPA